MRIGLSINIFIGLCFGGIWIVDFDFKGKASLIGCVFRFLEADKLCPWEILMRYYVGRALAVNDNSKPMCTVTNPFYSHSSVCCDSSLWI